MQSTQCWVLVPELDLVVEGFLVGPGPVLRLLRLTFVVPEWSCRLAVETSRLSTLPMGPKLLLPEMPQCHFAGTAAEDEQCPEGLPEALWVQPIA